MIQLIRWIFFGLGLLGIVVVLYLQFGASHLLGVRRGRLENWIIGLLSIVLLIGAWQQSVLGWYAGLAFCLYNVLEGLLRWRFLLGASKLVGPRLGMGVWLAFNGALIIALLSPVGRTSFHMFAS